MTSTPKRPRDTNQLAKMVVDIATGEATPEAVKATTKAIAGSVGGPARAASLSDLRRSEIAKKAALARWKRKDRTDA